MYVKDAGGGGGSSSSRKSYSNYKNTSSNIAENSGPSAAELFAAAKRKVYREIKEYTKEAREYVKKINTTLENVSNIIQDALTGGTAKLIKKNISNVIKNTINVGNELGNIYEKASQKEKEYGGISNSYLPPMEKEKANIITSKNPSIYHCDTNLLRNNIMPLLNGTNNYFQRATETTSKIPIEEGCESVSQITPKLNNLKDSVKKIVDEILDAIDKAEEAERKNSIIVKDLFSSLSNSNDKKTSETSTGTKKTQNYFGTLYDNSKSKNMTYVSNTKNILDMLANKLEVNIEGKPQSVAIEAIEAKIFADKYNINTTGKTTQEIVKEVADKVGVETNENYYSKSEPIQQIKQKWSSGYLTARKGVIDYYTNDGEHYSETWCPLAVGALVENIRKYEGINYEHWTREDGVQMYGPYVMVAADVKQREQWGGGREDAKYEYGDIVETSLGTGIVIDLCGRSQNTRIATNGEQTHFDIYTKWHDGGKYQQIGYSEEYIPMEIDTNGRTSSSNYINQNQISSSKPISVILSEINKKLTGSVESDLYNTINEIKEENKNIILDDDKIDNKNELLENDTSEIKSNDFEIKEDNENIIPNDRMIDNKNEPLENSVSEMKSNDFEIKSETTHQIKSKWDSGYLTARKGVIDYYTNDGEHYSETWCPLAVGALVENIRKYEGINYEHWTREDGVQMYGPYVMVAADVKQREQWGGGREDAKYEYGDIVETSLGTGIVIDLCGRSQNTRIATGGEQTHFDIYTKWHDGGKYQQIGYSEEYIPREGAPSANEIDNANYGDYYK